ncbi:MAG: nucleotidyltransferase family protein [Clostridia bacterium]|nr:nucleotidyltransferase family protein [Clostridia bacterium]
MITGIVAEYNPFHSGHYYQIERIKESGSDGIVAVMSGNFVQRCEPAFFRKHARAEAAVKGGVDLVIELPVRFATASAEKFAFGAVYLLDLCGCEQINFGSECGDISLLEACADKLIEADKNGDLAKALRREESFARARQKIGGEILSEPNNILGVEYIKAIKNLGSKMKLSTIQRTFGYHASASELRKNIPSGNFEGLPESTKEIILREKEFGKLPAEMKNLEKILLAFLRNAREEDFEGIYGINEKEGFGNRILNARTAKSLDEAFDMIKSKKYPLSTAKRGLLSAYLRIPKDDLLPEYIRPLAFNEKGREILKNISKKVMVVNNLAELTNGPCEIFAEEERRATDLFGLALPTIQKGFAEFTEKNIPYVKQ